MSDLWPAPHADGPVVADVTVPGSKSVTNRALVLAALAAEPGRLRRPLRSRDTELMAAALRALGAGVDDAGSDWVVTPAALRGPAAVDVGLAGTVMRFVPPVATVADGPVSFDGDPRARERPMGPLVQALRALGAEVDDGGRGGLPLTVVGRGGLPGGEVTLDASSSSQLVSGLLLTAPRWDDGVTVRHRGGRLPGLPFVRMTVEMLRDRGAVVDAAADRWRVEPGTLAGRDLTVEPDLSSAAPFLAAALVTGGRVRVLGWPATSPQAGAATPPVLERMGATWLVDDDGLVLTGTGTVHGVEVDLGDNPELVCVLAAVAAVADSPSRITGIGHLRGHETDRLAALARELGGLGARVRELPDGLVVEPAPMTGGVFHTYADHRMAMAAAVLGLVVPGVLVEDVATTAKTFPGFAAVWQVMLDGAAR